MAPLTGVAILGATGSIGVSTLAVLERHPERFRVVGLAARRSGDHLAELVLRHRPRTAILSDPDVALPRTEGSTVWHSGDRAILDLVTDPEVEIVVNALVGAAGLEPTLRALEAGKRVALANKESLVAGGVLVAEAAARGGGEIVPVDSEHSALLQCLDGCPAESVSRLVLTASGGPFRGWSREALRTVGPKEALRHPTWSMGEKITVDSATLGNKALEVIEAHLLFGVPYDRIDVVVHPQSVVHSLVEFVDGSVLAQMGFPTMELPILYALTYPERSADPSLRTFDPVRSPPLTFEAVDHDAFPLLSLGIDAGREGGTAPAIFNAANEIAVAAFLAGRLGFGEIPEVVKKVLDLEPAGPVTEIGEVLAADEKARTTATREIAALDTPLSAGSRRY